MTDDNVTTLKTVPPVASPSLAMTENSFAAMVTKHITDHDLIDLKGDAQGELELIEPQPGEVQLGALTQFEITMFTYAMLSQEIIHDVLLEAQAQMADHAANLLRQQRMYQPQEPSELETLTDDDRNYVNQLAALNHMTRANYEFSVRARTKDYDHLIVVRAGMTVYAVDG